LSAAHTEILVDAAASAAAAARGPRVWAELLRHPGVLFGGAVLILMLAIALMAPLLGTTNPAAIDPAHRNQLPGGAWFVTDAGGDEFARIA
jgi:peptide/nickel transport system permease protein